MFCISPQLCSVLTQLIVFFSSEIILYFHPSQSFFALSILLRIPFSSLFTWTPIPTSRPSSNVTTFVESPLTWFLAESLAASPVHPQCGVHVYITLKVPRGFSAGTLRSLWILRGRTIIKLTQLLRKILLSVKHCAGCQSSGNEWVRLTSLKIRWEGSKLGKLI